MHIYKDIVMSTQMKKSLYWQITYYELLFQCYFLHLVALLDFFMIVLFFQGVGVN